MQTQKNRRKYYNHILNILYLLQGLVAASYTVFFLFESHKFDSMHGTMSYDVISSYRVVNA